MNAKLILEVTILLLLALTLSSVLIIDWLIEKHPRTFEKLYKKSALVQSVCETFFID